MPSPPGLLRKRDDPFFDDQDSGANWYFSDQAAAIKYGVLFGILLLGFLVISGSWLHARQRLKKGLPPLAYHRWLVPPHLRGPGRGGGPPLRPENNFTFYQLHPVPPPVYNPHFAQPPAYPGPAGGSPPPMGRGEKGAYLGADPFADTAGGAGIHAPSAAYYPPGAGLQVAVYHPAAPGYPLSPRGPPPPQYS